MPLAARKKSVRSARRTPKKPTVADLLRARIERERKVSAKTPAPDIRRLLGHSDLRMTIRYTHLGQSHLDAAASRLDGVLTLPAPATEG
jgi:integrase